MRAPSLQGRTCGVSQSEGWQFMSVVIHPIGTPRNHCDPVNDAISYETAVVTTATRVRDRSLDRQFQHAHSAQYWQYNQAHPVRSEAVWRIGYG